MSLTKEKCKRALRELKMANDYPTSKFNDSRLIDFHLVTFEQLIEEHFDNQPLKFEELKENMWVFDNKYKEYCYIYFIAGKYPHRKYIDNCESDSEFEENRFFRYEVKE